MWRLLLGISLVPAGCGPAAAPARDSGMATPVDFILEQPIRCEKAAASVSWTETAATLGLGDLVPTGDDGGAAIADLDQDGHLDIVLSTGTSVDLWSGDGTGFSHQPGPTLFKVSGTALGDIDADGWLDVVLGGRHPAVLRQGGTGLEPMPVSGLPEGGKVRELRPLDADGDGDLDLYAARTWSPEGDGDTRDLLLLNRGEGAFEVDPTALPSELIDGRSFDVLLLDEDEDGRPDLYLVNDMGREHGGNALLRNEGGRFVDAGTGTGADRVMDGMGGHLADIDRDGLQDLYLADTGSMALLLRAADGSWVDATRAWAADPVPDSREMAWGAIAFDHDNDGWEDLLVAQGPFVNHQSQSSTEPQPLRLLRSTGSLFEDVSGLLGEDTLGTWRAVIADDLNEDGVLDLLVTSGREAPRLYLSDGCTAAGWLSVEAPEGSRVEVQAGGEVRVASISTDSAYAAARRPVAWFGLGQQQVVDSVVISLPWTGEEYRLDEPFEARRHIRLR